MPEPELEATWRETVQGFVRLVEALQALLAQRNDRIKELEAELAEIKARDAQPEQDPECPGPGECHGAMSWCERCGDTTCPDTMCDLHHPVEDEEDKNA